MKIIPETWCTFTYICSKCTSRCFWKLNNCILSMV